MHDMSNARLPVRTRLANDAWGDLTRELFDERCTGA
jgi:hypothetical protein